MEIESTPDPWLYVVAKSAADARRFFGAPSDWPCEYDGPFKLRAAPGATACRWRVKAEGLTVR